MTKDQLLRGYTGHDSRWWVARVQDLVSSHFEDSGDPRHPRTNKQWLHELVDEIAACCDWDDSKYDENIRAAIIAALVFTTWASRISHAKAYDPNRPLRLRRSALRRHRKLVAAILDAAVDETSDTLYFPGQEWNPPHGRSARGGDFV